MGITDRKRQREGNNARPKRVTRKFKKQKHYHSSSEEEDGGDSEGDVGAPADADKPGPRPRAKPPTLKQKKRVETVQDEPKSDADSDLIDGDAEVGSEEEASNSDGSSANDTNASSDESDAQAGSRPTKKRNDASALSTSISKILSSKVSASHRADPVLARSQAAAEANRELAESRLDLKARKKINADKRRALAKGRVEDVLGLESTDISTAQIQETEKRLKKTAQRGVVKLFNAVRAAQVQGEAARSEARKQGIVGMGQREERVGEMSKQGFLDLIAKGGKKDQAVGA